MTMKPLATRAILTCLVSSLLICGCGAVSEERPENVILIIVDTLRYDHLGCYGHAGNNTPSIDRLAREGIRFEDAVSQAPITLPSISSILTSLTPLEHGVHYNEGYRLPERVTTLAEVMSTQGLQTAAFVGSIVLDSTFGTAQGFDRYDARFPERFPFYQSSLKSVEGLYDGSQRRAEDITKSAVSWLKEKKERPFFLLLHYYDPHIPYDPPPPFAPQAGPDNYKEILSRQADYYDGEIAYTDQQIGLLLDELRELDLDRNTLIVFTSDHGEALGDNGEETHSVFLYEPTVRVPLILGGAIGMSGGRVINGQVRSIDIMPTVLDIMEIAPPPGISGRSLIPRVEGGESQENPPAYMETYANRFERGWSVLRGVRAGGWKFIQAPSPELYDLRKDPDETRNLFAEDKEVSSRLAGLLADMDKEAAGSERVDPGIKDKAFLEKVRSLGYAGAGDMDADYDAIDLSGPDPREMMKEFRRKRFSGEYMRLALFFMSSERNEAASYFLRKTIELSPDYALPRYYLAEILRVEGKTDEGLAEIDRVLELEPENADAWYLGGLLMSRAGREDEALEDLNKVVSLDPDYAEAYNNMGMIYGKRQEYDRALEMLHEAIRINPDLPQARANTGNAYYAMGRPEDAEREWELALLLDPERTDLHLLLGGSYFRRGQYEKALGHYQSYLATEPDSFTVTRVQGWIKTIRGKMAEKQ